MNINITKIVILTGQGTDKAFLYTDIVNTHIWPGNAFMALQFDVALGKGAEFVEKEFHIKPEIINI